MFERFTAPARQVVGFAQDEARLLERHYIGSEHLLLGLLRSEEGAAADVLTDLGVTLERLRGAERRLRRRAHLGPEPLHPARQEGARARAEGGIRLQGRLPSRPRTSCSRSRGWARAGPRASCSTSAPTPST